jgi:putative aldouronate transport system substrate-binding protein
MQPPKTIDQLVAVAAAFKNAKLGGANTYGLALNPKGNWGSIKGFFQGYGIPYQVWALGSDGKVAYGSVDSRMKDALLKLQEMYKAGLLRQDYVTANTTESITAGEAGIMYSICFGPVNAIDLYQLDPNVDLIACEIPTVNGSLPLYYDTAVPGDFIFINKDMKNKDAAVKTLNEIVANLYDFNYDWGIARGATPIGSVMYEKPYSFMEYARDIAYAYKTGDLSRFGTANAKTYYERMVNFEKGDRTLGRYYPIYRVEKGTYAIQDIALQSNRIRNTVYVAPDTLTMQERKTALDELLLNAINQVIMGANISVWDNAVREWSNTGGQTMTTEVNNWYQKQK